MTGAMTDVRRMRPLLGTFVELGVHAATRAEANRAIDAGFEAIAGVHARLSFQQPGSDLSRLNRSRGEWVRLHPGSLCVLRLALRMMRVSNGLFDITVGGLLVRRGALPVPDGQEVMDRGEADDIQLGSGQAKLRRPLWITLDGIAKGYAVDCAVRTLRQRGASAGWVNAGGDLRVFGELVLPVQRREADGSLRPLGGLRDAAIATSQCRGINEAPDADLPGMIVGTAAHGAQPGVFSVLARQAWRADALTKVACLAAKDEREELLRTLGGQLVLPPPSLPVPSNRAQAAQLTAA